MPKPAQSLESMLLRHALSACLPLGSPPSCIDRNLVHVFSLRLHQSFGFQKYVCQGSSGLASAAQHERDAADARSNGTFAAGSPFREPSSWRVTSSASSPALARSWEMFAAVRIDQMKSIL